MLHSSLVLLEITVMLAIADGFEGGDNRLKAALKQ